MRCFELVGGAGEAWPQAVALGRTSEGRINGVGQRELLGENCTCRLRSQGSRAGCREQSRMHKGCACCYRCNQRALEC